jgi:hypothetical protein
VRACCTEQMVFNAQRRRADKHTMLAAVTGTALANQVPPQCNQCLTVPDAKRYNGDGWDNLQAAWEGADSGQWA